MPIKEINISPKYGGGVVIKAVAEDGTILMIEKNELVAYILKAVNEKGYTTQLKPMQKYARLSINN